MNPPRSAQSFPDWQPPSPRSTPQSAKFSGYHFLSPPSSEPSPGFPQAWMTPQGYVYGSTFQAPGVYVNSTPEGISTISSLKRPRPISYQNVPGNGQPEQHAEVQVVQQVHPSMSFPSHSFLEQFHDTHIDKPQNDSANIIAPTAVPTQIKTPPPSRKTASKRKPHPPLVIPVDTPSTILSRRSSDHESWLKRSGNSSVSETSPFHFTPLQISPPDPTQFSSGPLTAPVYPHSQLFWDPNSNPAFDQAQLSATTENPFISNPQSAGTVFTFHRPIASTPTSATSHGFVVPPLPSHIPIRPQSAAPAPSQVAMPPPPRSTSHLRQASSVDPSMLVTAQLADPNALSRPGSAVNISNPEDRQPYQCQLDALRREKEGRLKKATRRQTTVDSSTIGFDIADLRRNVTDNRARKTVSLPQNNQAASAEASDVPSNLGSGPLSRNSSPLKRQKSSLQQPPVVSPLKPTGRKSVVLTVDAKGIARAEVKVVESVAVRQKDSTASFNASSSESDSDSSDLPDGPPHTRSSSSLSFRRPAAKSSPPSNDALDALRDVVKANNQRKQDASINLDGTVFGYGPTIPPNNTVPVVYNNQYVMNSWNISPTTVTDPDLQSPTDQDANYFTGTRCVCNNSIADAGQQMIQCESCLKWLHVECIGMTRNTIPRTFHCVYCTSNTPAARGTRIRAHTTPAAMPYYPVSVQTHNYV